MSDAYLNTVWGGVGISEC